MFRIFLDKSEIRNLDFFAYLEEKPFLTETREEILEDLSLSEFLLNKTIETLNSYFESYQLADDFQIVSDGNKVTLLESDRATSVMLEEELVKDSFGFNMLKDILFNKFVSVNDYAVEHYVSYPIVYRKLKELRKFLARYSVSINKKFELTGDEKAIQAVFSFYFTKLYGENLSEYPKEITTLVNHFLGQLTNIFQEPLSILRKSKLKQFLAIMFYRANEGKTFYMSKVQQELSNRLFLTHAGQTIFSWLTEIHRNRSMTQLKSEATRVIEYLIAEQILIDDHLSFLFETQENSLLTASFLTAVYDRFPISQTFKEELEAKVAQLHFQVLNFQIEKNMETQNVNITYFHDAYPEFFFFCKRYIENRKEQQMIWEAKQFLFYHYLLILVELLPLRDILEPIYICIDFSSGPTYNRLIQREVEKISNLNIIYQTHFSEKTDLVLTDNRFNEQLAVAQIIWLSPPRAIDWANFTAQLLEIRKTL